MFFALAQYDERQNVKIQNEDSLTYYYEAIT
jgi:hypothetical protein